MPSGNDFSKMAGLIPAKDGALKTWLAQSISDFSSDRQRASDPPSEQPAVPKKQSVPLQPVVEKWRAKFSRGL
jgi:hypothetical protein